MTSRYQRCILVLPLIALCMTGCSLFGGGEEEVIPPSELVEFQETIDVRRLWSTKIGGDAADLRLGLAPVSDAIRVYAASHDGRVHALAMEDGRKIWSTDLKMPLTAGPGVGDGRVVVAGSDGDVVTLDSQSGAELWRHRVAAEVLAAPAVGGERVVVRTADGRLIALNGSSGKEEWVIEEEVPRLSLRGTSAPVISANFVVCGFDNGRLMTVDLLEGTVVWEQTITAPAGRSDLERLVDIDGAVAAVGRDVYATGFRGNVVAVALESGQGLWGRELSSYVGPGVDYSHIYVSTDEGDLVALSRVSGVEQWRNDQLQRRELSGPTAFGEYVVVGDFEGYLHWFNATDGVVGARTRVGSGRVSGALATQGDLLLVQSESGVVAAFSVPSPDQS